MSGRLFEATKSVAMHRAYMLTGAATATYGTSVDTQGFDNAKIVLDVGLPAGDTSLAAAVYESDVNSPVSSVALTGASFTAVTSANGNALQTGAIACKNTKRYLFTRLLASADGNPTASIAVSCELGKADTEPTTPAPVFTV